MRFTYSKREKLKSKKLIDMLFVEGKSVKSYPLRMVYLQTKPFEKDILLKVGVSVSKRTFKLAVDRNRIKRLIRESYRLHQHYITVNGENFAILIIYIGRNEITQREVHKAMVKLFKRFNEALPSSSY